MSPCVDYGGVIICSVTEFNERWTHDCPVCGIADSEIVIHGSSNPYYGSRQVCTNCGDCWSDGELWGRPFRRGWRQESIAQAVADWEACCGCKFERDEDMYLIPCEHMATS